MDLIVGNIGFEHISHQIFDYLPNKDFINCLCVCQEWKNCLYKLLLHRQLDYLYSKNENWSNYEEPGYYLCLNRQDDWLQAKKYLKYKMSDEEQLEIIKVLYEWQTYVERTRETQFPFEFAATKGYLNFFLLLKDTPIHCNARVQYTDTLNQSPIRAASQHGHLEIVKFLLEIKDVSVHRSLLMDAVTSKNCQLIEYLLDQSSNFGFDINCRDYSQRTILHYICQYGFVDIFNRIVKLDKELLNHQDDTGKTPMHYACNHGSIEIVKQLLKFTNNWIDLADNYGRTPVNYACGSGNIEVVKLLLDFGKLNKRDLQIGLPDNRGKTILHNVCQRCDIEMVELLLDFGRDINIDLNIAHRENVHGQTALHFACKQDSVEIVRLLLDFGKERYIDLANVEDKENRTVLFQAVYNPITMDIFKYLMSRYDDIGLNLTHQDKDGKTVVAKVCTPIVPDPAQAEKLIILLDFAKERAINVNTVDIQNRSLLHLGVLNNSSSVVKILLERLEETGIDINHQDFYGKTALENAKTATNNPNFNPEVLDILEQPNDKKYE